MAIADELNTDALTADEVHQEIAAVTATMSLLLKGYWSDSIADELLRSLDFLRALYQAAVPDGPVLDDYTLEAFKEEHRAD
jgi:hypothetical protein